MIDLVESVRAEVLSNADEQLDCLKRLVALETPTQEPKRTREGLTLLATEFHKNGYQCRMLSGSHSGGQLYARSLHTGTVRRTQLLLGHVDTVWPTGSLMNMPLVVENGCLKGPGVYDMKSGLCNMLFALRAIRALKLEPSLTPTVFINTDEETGSHESTGKICRLARLAQRAYVMEPSLGRTGMLKTARKGVGHYTITAHGVAAHAGLNPQGGASAILELSHVVQSLFALNDHGQGVSINVGRIDGGMGANIIAPTSSCEVDVRVPTTRQALEVDQAIHALESITPGVRLEIEGGLRRPPLEPTPDSLQLASTAQGFAAQLGFKIGTAMAGGGSDGNDASQFTPTLDGLGAVGDGAHAHHEFVYIDQLVERTAMLALLIMAPSKANHQEEDSSCKASFVRL